MVMGGGSCSKGLGFKSWHHILDGHFLTYICCKNGTDVSLKRPKINYKRSRVGPFKKVNNGTKLSPVQKVQGNKSLWGGLTCLLG